MDIHKQYCREFLSEDENLGDTNSIKDAFKRLLAIKVGDSEEALNWTQAWSEVVSAVNEVIVRAYFAMTRNTRDKEAEKEFSRIADEVIPLLEEIDAKAKKVFLEFPEDWTPKGLYIARKNAEWAVEIFREKNLPLISKEIKLGNEYNKIKGDWETTFKGKKVTPQQLNPYLESPDRELREDAWRAKVGMHLVDYDKLNDLFNKMLSIRKEIAKNADMEDYVAYQYKNYKRLSYDRDDTEKFRYSILNYVVPAVTKIIERRKKLMGIDNLRPWDLKADPQGEEPPVIYKTIDELKEITADVLSKVDEQFGEAFRLMDKKGYLDIENRPGKAPGAYMNEFSEERIPLIFANSVGTSRDFDTLIHEGGHAIHGFSKRHLLYPARRVPIEFAEVASMSLELLARPYWHIVYNEEDRERIGIKQLEDTLLFLPFMAMIDEFQNWVYTNKDGEKSDKRAEYWCKLETKYRPQIDYKGLEDEQKIGWQYDHVFTAPLYYVEYGIAQVGALQVYIRSITNYDRAVEDYKKALSLGNIVSLPELFSEAGVKFVMNSPEVLKEVVDIVMKKIGLDE